MAHRATCGNEAVEGCQASPTNATRCCADAGWPGSPATLKADEQCSCWELVSCQSLQCSPRQGCSEQGLNALLISLTGAAPACSREGEVGVPKIKGNSLALHGEAAAALGHSALLRGSPPWCSGQAAASPLPNTCRGSGGLPCGSALQALLGQPAGDPEEAAWGAPPWGWEVKGGL